MIALVSRALSPRVPRLFYCTPAVPRLSPDAPSDGAAGDAVPGRRQAGRRDGVRVFAEAEVPDQGQDARDGGLRVLHAGQPGGRQTGRADRGEVTEFTTKHTKHTKESRPFSAFFRVFRVFRGDYWLIACGF